VSDWTDGFAAHVHILAPSTYIFFASVIPALTFGEQLSDETEGQINGVHVLITTAMCGTIQALFGGQPLLIVGVAEPIVLVYGYMFIVAKTYEIPFVPWASVTLFWVALMCALLAIMNSCCYIHHFTRFSGELFGLLIALLFLQQAIKGLASEFQVPAVHRRVLEDEGKEPSWLLFNGAFALFLAFGLLGTSLASVGARHWNVFNGFIRRIITEYGTALAVLVWTLVSMAPHKTPDSIPRRLAIPDTFDGSPNYTVLSRLDELEGWHIAAALVPAGIIAVLFFFDHNVSSQLAQEGLHLTKPTAYHWDLMVLALMTLACGLLGLPPVNGVIPQAPMHSRANTVWLKDEAKKREDEDGTDAAAFNVKDEAHGGRDFYIRENRVSNLVQSVLCGVCLLITPILQQIPRSVLWGFFAFMAIEGLPGNQFYKRLMLFFTDSSRLHKLTDVKDHDSFLDHVPMQVIFKFSAFQLAGLLVCYGITWAGIAGISFPLFIMLLVPAREYIMPRFFTHQDLHHLDPLDLAHQDNTDRDNTDRDNTERDNTDRDTPSSSGADLPQPLVPRAPMVQVASTMPLLPLQPNLMATGMMATQEMQQMQMGQQMQPHFQPTYLGGGYPMGAAAYPGAHMSSGFA